MYNFEGDNILYTTNIFPCNDRIASRSLPKDTGTIYACILWVDLYIEVKKPNYSLVSHFVLGRITDIHL
jgi:hypothetical protein